MPKITYSLLADQRTSDEFYRSVSIFSEQVYRKVVSATGGVIHQYAAFVRERLQEPPRSQEEYGIELLSLAMTWRRYLGAAQCASAPLMMLLCALYGLRRNWASLRPIVDPIRGWLAGKALVPKIGALPLDDAPCFKGLNRLILWLSATGEFNDEVKRFQNWLHFFRTMNQQECGEIMTEALRLFDWFKRKAKEKLGSYTVGVERFLRDEYKGYRGREDEVFCGKEEVEYHINMVASEIMNRGLRAEFARAPRRVVLVPSCMRSDQGIHCRAGLSGGEMTCVGCSNSCRINSIRQTMTKEGCEVYIIPHSSSFTRWLRQWRNTREYGIVAVACVLNIAVGGYQMRELGIPSQCVLLDYCGCKKHWHKYGVATNLNVGRLMDVTLQGVGLGRSIQAQTGSFVAVSPS